MRSSITFGGFLARFPKGCQAYGIANVFQDRVRLLPMDLSRVAGKNALLVRRPAHHAALRSAGYL